MRARNSVGLLPLLALTMLSWGVAGPLASAPAPWLYRDLRLRVPVTVGTGLYSRHDALARGQVDFTALVSKAGASGAVLDVNSIRLAIVDGKGKQKEVPYAFFKAEDFDAKSSARGEVVWQLPGEVEALESRRYFLYFDTLGATPRKAPQYPAIPGAGRRPVNLVTNPGFEQVSAANPTEAAQWEVCSDGKSTGALAVVGEPRHSGERALKITCTAGRWFGCKQERIPIKPNALYRVGLWARADPANQTEGLVVLLTAWVRNKDDSYVKLENAKFQTSVAIQPDRWVQLLTRGLAYKGVDVPTPPDAALCQMQITLYPGSRVAGAEATGTVYIDDVEMVEVVPEDKTPPVAVEVGVPERAK